MAFWLEGAAQELLTHFVDGDEVVVERGGDLPPQLGGVLNFAQA
jgi:hypothetical protein